MNEPGPGGRRAVGLLSGGLDSGVAVASWLADGGVVERVLFADYGQRAVAAEARASEALAGRLGLTWERLDLTWLGVAARAAGSALVTGGGAEPPRSGSAEAPGDAASAAAVWVPARNVVLGAAAAAWAEALGAGFILAGFNREEAATFPDNSPAFVAAFDTLLALGTRSGAVQWAAPTLDWDKREIVARARALQLGPGDFWSCYLDGAAPCHACESCRRSERAWAASR